MVTDEIKQEMRKWAKLIYEIWTERKQKEASQSQDSESDFNKSSSES